MRFVIVRVFAFGVSKAPKIQNHTKNHIVDMYIYMFPHPCSSSKFFLFSVSKKNYSILSLSLSLSLSLIYFFKDYLNLLNCKIDDVM